MSSEDPTVLPPDFLERYFEVTLKTILWSCLIGVLSVCGAMLLFYFYEVFIAFNQGIQWGDVPIGLFMYSLFWFLFGKGWIICLGYSVLYVAVLRKTFLNKTLFFGLPTSHLLLVVGSIVSLFFMPEIMLG